ncbi:MAG: cyclic pyranopterin monophosphate synthase MoaC [Candidatus Hydrogenedentes bacterium]|nr:cyclic pyranopterin monophosphate synthase MoaC [Candidatus Hydrogenedentota bacterium]
MLSHIDENNQPRMVDVGEKSPTQRSARARAVVALPDAVWDALQDGDIQSKKGPVFQTAIVAGTMAAKKTSELIPFCHPIGLDHCHITIEPNDRQELVIECETRVTHKTGVEMEALTGATVAALTVYDMCKALSHDIAIKDVQLVEKRGGKSDYGV